MPSALFNAIHLSGYPLFAIEEVEDAIEQVGIKVLEIPREALFLAGKHSLIIEETRVLKVQPFQISS
nr:hypothetical protein [uncultured Desulfobacter sp.]